MSWINGPLAGFDVETTGVDAEMDRIVTYCVTLQEPGYSPRIIGAVVNPGVPIPEAATQVHGVTDADAEFGQAPTEALVRIVAAIYAAWDRGAPLVVYNAPFDLTMLDRECRRHLGPPGFEIRGPVIDPLVLDKAIDKYRPHLPTCAIKRGGVCDCGNSRRLSDVCAHYGITLAEEDAHSAAGDAKAALQLAIQLGKVMSDGTDGSLADLYRQQVGWYADQRSSFFDYLRRKGEQPDNDSLDWPLIPYTDKKVHA